MKNFISHTTCRGLVSEFPLKTRRLAACTQAVITVRSTSYIVIELLKLINNSSS